MPSISNLFANEQAPETKQYGYVAFYQQQRIDVWAPTLLEARNKAVAHFKARKPHMISVVLAEKDGRPVLHVAND